MSSSVAACAGQVAQSQLELVGLYSDEAEAVPHSNPKLATWEEDLVEHLVKVEDAKKVSWSLRAGLHLYFVPHLYAQY